MTAGMPARPLGRVVRRGAAPILGLALAALGGCAEPVNPPLIFAQAQSVGVTASASPTLQSGELVVGYRDANVALVPVVIRQADGNYTQIMATSGEHFQDSLSVLGQFDLNAGGAAAQVGLGTFFATGTAAQKLADGFAAQLGAERAGTNPTDPRLPASAGRE